jgi:DNA-directed RNA polymerase specialized sigma24 family protein
LQFISNLQRPRSAFLRLILTTHINYQTEEKTMAHSKFQPNYTKLYPNTAIDSKTLKALRESDRKAEYMERDLKRERYLRDKHGKVVLDSNGQAVTLPARETSFDQLCEAGYSLPIAAPSAEDMSIETEFPKYGKLYRSLKLLTEDERALITALFFKRQSEREYADSIGVKKQSVNEKKLRILRKLKKLLES